MRKNSGTLNSQLSRVFSELGHTDQLVVTDAGLPIPSQVERVDLALSQGVPGFLQVLDQVLAEITVEGAVAPAEIEQHSPDMLAALRQRLRRRRCRADPRPARGVQAAQRRRARRRPIR